MPVDAAISVIIPTQNRCDLLIDVIRGVLSQSMPSEIFVMDDGSVDETVPLIRQTFPADRFDRLHLIRSEVSRGPAWQRNQGMELATGEYVFTIDDDCVLTSPDVFARTVADFDRLDIGAVTLPFVNDGETQIRTVATDGTPQVTMNFYGGMVAFRRGVFRRVGGYRSEYFMHGEERDLSLRLLAQGAYVRLGAAPALRHVKSVGRSQRVHELGPQNVLLFSWLNVPAVYLAPQAAISIFLALRHALRIGQLRAALRGLTAALRQIVRGQHRRQPVSARTYWRSRKIATQRLDRLTQVLDTAAASPADCQGFALGDR